MVNEKYCQSCGMPMGQTDEHYGTEADGSKSTDYCGYCYDKGAFTGDCTMEQMIEICVPHVVQNAGMSEQAARDMMKQHFPMLKRWNNN